MIDLMLSSNEEVLDRLKHSTFRSSFHLRQRERLYAADKGGEVLERHAVDFVRLRLAPAIIPNDGKQTPMRNHPVFLAQHACACCCRGCLNRWYGIPKGVELSDKQQERIVSLLMAWVNDQMSW